MLQAAGKIDTYSLAITFLECWYLHERVRNEKMVAGFIQYIIIPAIHPDPSQRIDVAKILKRYTEFLKYWKLKPTIRLSKQRAVRAAAKEPKNVPGYVKDFARCKKTEANGGYNITELRALAKTYGIVATNRKDICAALDKLTEK
jgi:hypothetical protein